MCVVAGSAGMLCPVDGENDFVACFRMQGSKIIDGSYAIVFKKLVPALNALKLFCASQITFAAAVNYFYCDGYVDGDLCHTSVLKLMCPENLDTEADAATCLLNDLVATERVNVISVSSRLTAAVLLLHAGAGSVSTDLIRRAAQFDGPLFGLLTQWHIQDEVKRTLYSTRGASPRKRGD